MDLHKLSIKITNLEAKKREVSIAQVKEILKITLILLGEYNDKEIIKTINRYRLKEVLGGVH